MAGAAAEPLPRVQTPHGPPSCWRSRQAWFAVVPGRAIVRRAVAIALAAAALGCASTSKHAEAVGNPPEMAGCCERARTVCPAGDNWVDCQNDLFECHRLGLWYEDGIKVSRDPGRARAIFESMCDRHELSSCDTLCKQGDLRRCVDIALLGIAGGGGRPFPPRYDVEGRALFAKACKGGDDVACLALELAYVPGRQPVVRVVGSCFDDHARCYAKACTDGDPLGCAVLCHAGDARGCMELGRLGLQGTGFRRSVTVIADRMLGKRCYEGDKLACKEIKPEDCTDGRLLCANETPWDWEQRAREAESRPRPVRVPPPPQRHVGEGLWSGWKTVHNTEGGSPGLSTVVTRTAGAGHRSTDASWLAGFFAEIFMRSWYPRHDKYLRFNLAAAIGGGTAGLDGQVSQESSAGWRFPLASSESNPYAGTALVQAMSEQDRDALHRSIFSHSPHALFVRGGYALRYAAIGPVLSSAIELPKVDAGYHFVGDREGLRALELRASAGLVLVGRYNVDGERNALGGGVALGGGATLHASRAHVELLAQRIQSALQGAHPPVHRFDSNACLRLVPRDDGRHTRYLLCFQERLETGAPRPGPDTASWQTVIYFGLDGLD
jgi:hypothetical protein